MWDSLPRYYDDSRIVGNIVDREAKEFELLDSRIRETLDQFFIETSTWGLMQWERICGITTDLSKPIEQRRAVVKSKMRGVGTVTVSLIKSIAESWYNGEVDVTERCSEYTVDIKFVSRRGVPDNLADIKAALREIIPAHLAIVFKFTFFVWDELDAQLWTWDTLDEKTLTWDELKIYQP